MLLTIPQIETILWGLKLPEGYEWLQSGEIIHFTTRGDGKVLRVAYLRESREKEPIVATIEIGVIPVPSAKYMDGVKAGLQAKVEDTIRDIKEFREKLDAQADDAGRG